MSKINGFFLYLFGVISGALIVTECAQWLITDANATEAKTPPFAAQAPSISITWSEAETLVSKFHKNNDCLYGKLEPGKSLPPGGKPPYLYSWFVDRASIDSCLTAVNGQEIDGIRFYPVEVSSRDASGVEYDHHSLLFVPTVPDTMTNGDIVHNNVKKAWDYSAGCPIECNHDSVTRLGDDYVPPY